MSSPQAEPQRFAFSSNNLDASLARYRVDPATGQLRFLDYRPLGKSTPAVKLDPSGRFVLATSQAVDRVYVFRLDRASGALHEVAGSPFDVRGRAPFTLVFHPSGRFLYMAHRFAGVGAYRFDPETGAVTPLPGSPYPAGRRTRSVVLTPSGRFLYALNAYANTISVYGVNQQSGTLTEIADSPFKVGEMGKIDYLAQQMPEIPDSAGGLPYHMTLDPQGRFAFVANAAAASVSVFRLDAQSGRLSEVAGSPFFTGFNPYSVTVRPDGRFVYVVRARDDVVAVHALDSQTGRLTPVPGSPFPSGGETPAGIVFAADSHRAYVNNMASNDVAQLDVDTASGALKVREVVKTRSGPWAFTLAEGDPPRPERGRAIAALAERGLGRYEVNPDGLSPQGETAGGGEAVAVAVKPGGRYVYAANRDKGSVTAFRRDPASGELTPLADGEVPAGAQPSDIAVDRNGWYLYATNAGDDSLSVYYLDPDSGLPKPVRGSPVPTGRRPSFISLDPAARYAYVVNSDSDNVSVYRYRNNVTPLIFESVGHGSPYAVGREPVALAVDPTGRYAYVANAGSNDISAYHIHHQTGALAALPGSPFKAGGRPLALVAHPNGRFLYVANHDSATIGLYRIEAGLGAIAPVGSPLKLPLAPKGLWLSPSGETAYVLAADGRRLLTYAVDGASGALRLRSDGMLPAPISDLTLIADPPR